MARLHEYQGKAILAENGFKIPRGRAASTADEAVSVAKELLDQKGSEVVVKIQAWTTGRAGIGGGGLAEKTYFFSGPAARQLGKKKGKFFRLVGVGLREIRSERRVFFFFFIVV